MDNRAWRSPEVEHAVRGLDRSWQATDEDRDAPRPTSRAESADSISMRVRVLTPQESLERAIAYRAAVDAAYQTHISSRGASDKLAEHADSALEATTIVDKYPADYVRSTRDPPRIDGRHETPCKWLRDVNEDVNLPGRDNNCGECARAVYSTWYGRPAAAAAMADLRSGGEPARWMAEWAGQRPVLTTMAEIGQRLAELGPGSSAIIGCDWKDCSGGHWFNAVNDAGNVLAVDGQRNRVGSWPPAVRELRFDESRMKFSDAIFFDPDGKVVRS